MSDYPGCFEFSISHTTREPREGEVNGKDYFFVTQEEFDKMVEEGAFIEYEQNYGKSYGTSKAEIKRLQDSNVSPILDIDSKGLIHVVEKGML